MKRYIRSDSDFAEFTKYTEAYDGSVRVRDALRTYGPEILAKLAEDRDKYVRQEVAKCTDDPELLAKLAEDEYLGVRWAVAYRTNEPKIFAKLANDASFLVRRGVAERTNDPKILAKLANDEDEGVRKVAASRARELVNDTKDVIDSWPDADWWYSLDDESFEDAWQEYLSAPEDEVNKELQIFPEPSVQGSMGGLFVFDESGQDRKGEDEDWYIDWQEYLDWQIDAAATSKNASQYKKKYRKFMKDLCGI